MKVRLQAIKKHNKNVKDISKRYKMSDKYFKFLKNRTKKNTFKERKNMKFKY